MFHLQLAVSAALLFCSVGFAEVKIGVVPEVITLVGDSGEKVTGGPWTSSELKGKVHVLFYVDPDESELNDHVSAALKSEKFSQDQFGSVAIINMAATWKPNFAINSVLKKKQEEFPNTIYVKDLHKLLVKSWHLGDDNSDVVAFDKKGTVIFRKDGKLNEQETSELIGAIKKSL